MEISELRKGVFGPFRGSLQLFYNLCYVLSIRMLFVFVGKIRVIYHFHRFGAWICPLSVTDCL